MNNKKTIPIDFKKAKKNPGRFGQGPYNYLKLLSEFNSN